MRLASMILNDFRLFADSDISKMSITFTEDVQLTVGTNGSGKSSFTREISPFPTVRSLFGKEGLKSQVFENDGVYYRLESDYSKPSSPHLFFEGDSEENLNVGRTTETQKELIEQHLGVTPLIDDLMMNRYVFPRWGAAKRKEFLMGVNPDQIGFVLTKIKIIATKIKACKNNLSRLQQRKITLEQELLDPDALASLQAEKQIIDKDLGDFQQHLMDIEVGLRTVRIDNTQVSHIDLSSVRKAVRQCHYRLSGLAHVNRDDRQRQFDREAVLSKMAVCDQRLQEADEAILTKSEELVELETRYREISFDGDLLIVDTTIARLEGERDKLQIPRPDFEISKQDLESRYRDLDVLHDKLEIFSNLSVPLLPSKKRQQRERLLSTAQYRQSSYRMRMSDLMAQREKLQNQHSVSPKDIPDSPCAKDRCPLYAHFMRDYQFTEKKRQATERAIEKGTRKITRLDMYVDAVGQYFQNAKPYTERIQWLVTQAQSNPILHQVLRKMDILSVLSTNPNRIERQLKDAYGHIEQWLKLKDVLSDLETAYAFKSRQISSESHDTIKLVESIEANKKALYALRGVINKVTREKHELAKHLRDITTFSEVKSTILDIRARHIAMQEALANAHERDKLMVLQRGVTDLRQRHFLRLSDIERTLRDQASVRDRYQEEVMSQIGAIEKELSDLQRIEASLVVIPKENMVAFINDVFDQANRFIEAVWTVPLKIEPVTMEAPLNYEFQVSGDNDTLREMALGSEGQVEILSLAINLSLRVVLEHMNYPLCLDEAGRTMDSTHRDNMVKLLKRLLDDRVISQLMFVSHHASIHDNFTNVETLVLREDNILLPAVYNQHVSFN